MIVLENIIRKNILSLEPYSSARDEFKGIEGVFLDANENPYGTLNRYPDPLQVELKQQLTKINNIHNSNIFIGNGSDEVIDLAYRIFCNPREDKALTFTPTYGMYGVSASINNVKLLTTPLNENFQINRDNLKPYLKQPKLKLIFICSPNNPTGNLINKDDVIFILKNFNGVVIVDEAYIDFSPKNSLINLIGEYNNLIISQTLSKAWGLAAARIGIAYSNKEIINYYNKVKPPYNISQINQKAALDSLKDSEKYKNNLIIILKEKKRLYKELKNINIITKVYPSQSNFFLIEVNNANWVYNQLINHKIIIRNRAKQVKNCLRITVGTPKENNQLLKALKELS